MSDVLNVHCTTCHSARTLPRPPWPATLRHTCDPIEPNRAYWVLLPEAFAASTGTL